MGHYYNHTGHRVLKKRKDGILVYNINRLYELAVIPSEGERHTIYIYGQQGEMVAQRTINDAPLLAANQRRAHSRALAKWADDGSLVGSVQAGYFLLGPELSDKENLTDTLRTIFILLVLMGLVYWGFSVYQERRDEQERPFLQVNAFLVSLSVLYAFSFFRCGVNAPVFDGTEWTDEVVAIPPEVPGVEDPDNDPTNHDGPQDPNQPAPIASFPVEGIYFYHQDHLGSPALITNGAGVVVTVLVYKPYGELDLARSSGPDIIRYKYTLQEQDVETGLYNYRARYYGAASGSFTSADSLVPNSKDAGSYNRYGYVKGNPLKYVDPTGHFAVVAVVLGALLGGFSGYKIAKAKGYDWKDWQTYGYIMGGALIGGISGHLGASIAASKIAMAKTVGIAYASTVYTSGMAALSDGAIAPTISIGVASYNFETGELGYLGKKNNKWYENAGYTFGGLANLSDTVALFGESGNVDVNAEYPPHSSTTNAKNNSTVTSVGPDGSNVTNDYPVVADDIYWRVRLNNVNVTLMKSYRAQSWSIWPNNCAYHVGMSLNRAGVLNLPIPIPEMINLQMEIRSIGIHSSTYLADGEQ